MVSLKINPARLRLLKYITVHLIHTAKGLTLNFRYCIFILSIPIE